MSVDDDLALSRRLRQCRESLSPPPSQEQLGAALGVSRQQVAQWESPRAPKVPPENRIDQYARLFAVRQGASADLVVKERDELTGSEVDTFAELRQELLELRRRALNTGTPVRADEGWFWRFDDGRPITIIGSTQPTSVLSRIPESDPHHPDYTRLLRNADGDAEIELYSHLRANNPAVWITRYLSEEQIPTGALQGHVVVLGGGGVNHWARWFAQHMGVPVGLAEPLTAESSTAEWRERRFVLEGGSADGGTDAAFRARFDGTISVPTRDGGSAVGEGLNTDVALIARGRNPLNVEATATLIYGLFARGTVGAVQTFTDHQYIAANEAYLASKSSGSARSQDFWLLFEVLCDRIVTITTTPQLNKDGTVLREWFA